MFDDDGDDYFPMKLAKQFYSSQVNSQEIVEDKSKTKSEDVFVAVGKDDLDVLKWVLDHVVSPGTKIFLVHVYPPITFIPTPVGRVARSQVGEEQVNNHINEEKNTRKILMRKYISLCSEAKVNMDIILLQNSVTKQAILDLIPKLNITKLVIGTKTKTSSRWLRTKMGKGEFVKKNAPQYCEVSILYNGKKLLNGEQSTRPIYYKRYPGSKGF